MNKNEKIIMQLFDKLHNDLVAKKFVTDRSGVKTVEKINVNINNLDPYQKELVFNGRRTPIKYVEKEKEWYNSMSLNIKGYVDDVKIWQDVADKHGFVNSNYGWCIYSVENSKQFVNSVEVLKKNPFSRRSVMIYNRPSMQYDYNRDGMNDFMCTFSTQHFIRDNKLEYIVNQRSMDMIFGLFNDLAWHQEVYGKMFDALKSVYSDLDVGSISFNVGSAHVYERHFSMLEKIVVGDEIIF